MSYKSPGDDKIELGQEWSLTPRDYFVFGHITQLSHLCRDVTTSKGFWTEKETFESCVGEKIALMHSELSEALEAARSGRPQSTKIQQENFVEELADCVIRILDFSGKFNLPLEDAIYSKIEYNMKRAFKHGKVF